jgi:DNA-binding NarL/FixJ family response regulator
MTNVLIFDPYPILRVSVSNLIKSSTSDISVFETSDSEELQKLIQENKIDLVLLGTSTDVDLLMLLSCFGNKPISQFFTMISIQRLICERQGLT